MSSRPLRSGCLTQTSSIGSRPKTKRKTRSSRLAGDKVFRDPVHGDISFPGELLTLIDTPEFQRLRGIKMLGTASLVYPGAVHTRFEHSLGTSWLTWQLLTQLREAGGAPPLEPDYELACRAAALLHDVTHIPFGHTIEDERRIFPRHDTPARVRSFLNQGLLARRLKALGIGPLVLEILTGQIRPSYLQELVSGTICADLLDYLARDAYFCGLSHRYDRRVLRSLRIDDEGGLYLDACKRGLIRHDVLSEVVNLLRLRYFLSERVYFHHTKTASGAMLSRAIEQALEQGLTLKDLTRLGDERLLGLLETRFGQDSVVARVLEHLNAHSIYKGAYVITRRVGEERRRQLVDRYHTQATGRAQAEADLSRALKLKPGELIVYCPAYGMQLKEAQVRVRIDRGPARLLSDLGLPELEVLKERHQDLWKFYVFVAPARMSQAERISRACEEYFGELNHLPALEGGQLVFNF